MPNMVLHESYGTLQYGRDYRLVVEIDPEIARYYRSLIPKYYYVQGTRWMPHITVVRCYKETPLIKKDWGKYHGKKVKFLYSPIVHSGQVYFWLNAFCKQLEEIRKELGLSVVSQYTLPPEGFEKCFHITIGNRKNIPP